MTQGYGNQESAADTKAAKQEGAKDQPAAPKPEADRDDRKDVATPGDGAGPDKGQGKDVDPGVG